MSYNQDKEEFIKYLQFQKHYSINTVESYQRSLNEFIDFLNAIHLFHDFMEWLFPKKTIKVLICCSSALTSSYLVEELKEYIQKNHENIDIEASSFHHICEKGKDKQLILLAPQVGYLAKKYTSSFNIQVIPTNIYATYNYSKIVEMIKSSIKS